MLLKLGVTSPALQVDITGGLDSRLVAAMLAASPLRDRVEYLQTRGIEEGHEIQVGKAVAENLGYPHRALTTAPSVQTADWLLATLRSSVFRYESGICPSDGLILPGQRSRVTVTGAAGEIYRRHCKPHMKARLKGRKELEMLFQNYHQKTDPLGIEREDVRAGQRLSMQRLATGYFDRGVDVNDVTDVFFMRYRLPLWNGILLNNIYGAVRMYPLVNYDAARYAFSRGYEARIQDRLHFELLLAINPALCAMPFLDHVWPTAFAAKAAQRGVALPGIPFPVTGSRGMLQASGGNQLTRMMTDGWGLVRSYLLDAPHSRLWDVFDRAALEQVLNQPEGTIRNVVEAKQIYAALGIQCAIARDWERRPDGRCQEPVVSHHRLTADAATDASGAGEWVSSVLRRIRDAVSPL